MPPTHVISGSIWPVRAICWVDLVKIARLGDTELIAFTVQNTFLWHSSEVHKVHLLFVRVHGVLGLYRQQPARCAHVRESRR